ncbi:hypothetical protein Btru_073175 [Bulinus truncatus]|nr:hypothetical protein Btru_073175 [Bulinus truncatus]
MTVRILGVLIVCFVLCQSNDAIVFTNVIGHHTGSGDKTGLSFRKLIKRDESPCIEKNKNCDFNSCCSGLKCKKFPYNDEHSVSFCI